MTQKLHEKIHLSVEDIKYLQQHLLENARVKLNLNLPSSSQDTQDPLTLKIVEMIEEFILEMLEMSRHSLVIDGDETVQSISKLLDKPLERKYRKSFSPKNVLTRIEIAPFDMELNQELRKVYQQVEQETLEVTQLRREYPAKALELYKESFNDSPITTETEETQLDQLDQLDSKIPRLDSIIEDYNESLQQLAALKAQLPKQANEMDKLNQLITFLNKS